MVGMHILPPEVAEFFSTVAAVDRGEILPPEEKKGGREKKRRGRPPLRGSKEEKRAKARTRQQLHRARETLRKKKIPPRAAQVAVEMAEMTHLGANVWEGRRPGQGSRRRRARSPCRGGR